MDDHDYSELRFRLMAHQALLSAVIAAHPDKERLLAYVEEVVNQMQSLILNSHFDDKTIQIFNKEIQSILKKSGLKREED